MPQFFIDRELTEESDVEIRGADAHHIADVLRLAEGDWLVLSDGRGSSFRATIIESRPRSVRARVGGRIPRREGRPAPALAIASIRGERLEWAVQKCVELGSSRIIPFDSKRTVRPASSQGGGRKARRLEKIALEAAKQSGLAALPSVEAPISFEQLCESLAEFSPAILLYEGERTTDIRSVLAGPRAGGKEGRHKAPILIVGPEGGFTAEEVARATSRGAIAASLGSQILRVETAAVAAMAICQYELGNMDPS